MPTVTEIYIDLGYGKVGGVCYGYSVRAIEASLLEEDSLFDARIKRIVTSKELMDAISEVKAKKGEKLTDDDHELLDILSFYDSVALFQAPGSRSALFNTLDYELHLMSDGIALEKGRVYLKEIGGKIAYSVITPQGKVVKDVILNEINAPSPFNQVQLNTLKVPLLAATLMNGHTHSSAHLNPLNFETISYHASSDKISAQGGLRQIYSAPFIHDEQEIKDYLDSLSQVFESFSTVSKKPLGILLSNAGHATSLSCYPGRGWLFRNLNNEVQSFEKDATSALAAEIAKAFQANPYSAFNVSIILTAHDARCALLEAELLEFKKSYPINKAIARRFEAVNLAYIAAQYGHADVIAELAKHEEADLNLSNLDKMTPSCCAAIYGHADVIRELAKHDRVDLNKADLEGRTPSCCAAINGHADVIRELAKHDRVDLNKADLEGRTPTCFAAWNGHVDVIKELAKHDRVDLNEADLEGMTPACFAAFDGQADVIRELAKHDRVDLNKGLASKGATPILLAATKGHVAVIKELAKYHRVNLNITNSQGLTAAFIAAQMGHYEVIQELIKCEANMGMAFSSSVESLQNFAHVDIKDKELIINMQNFINRKLAEGDKEDAILMRPIDIAAIMNHKEIVGVLQRYENFKIRRQIDNAVNAFVEYQKKGEKLTFSLFVMPSNSETQCVSNFMSSFFATDENLPISPKIGFYLQNEENSHLFRTIILTSLLEKPLSNENFSEVSKNFNTYLTMYFPNLKNSPIAETDSNVEKESISYTPSIGH